MPSLHEIQTGFADSIFTRDDTGFEKYIVRSAFPPERHVQIYRNNVFASLTSALQDVYPVVTRLVGEGFLKYAADEFIRRHPPRGGNLHDFGGEFAEFLAGFPPAAKLEYLPDVARLEWAYHRVFHGPNHAPLKQEALAAVPVEAALGIHASRDSAGYASPEGACASSTSRYGELKFMLHPASRLLSSDYPILRIWQVNQPGYQGDDTVDLSEGGVRLLVIRRDITVEIQPLSQGDFALLQTLAAGKTFETACNAALIAEPDVDLTGSLRRHVQNATLVDLHF